MLISYGSLTAWVGSSSLRPTVTGQCVYTCFSAYEGSKRSVAGSPFTSESAMLVQMSGQEGLSVCLSVWAYHPTHLTRAHCLILLAFPDDCISSRQQRQKVT